MTGGMLLFYCCTVILGIFSFVFLLGLYGMKQEKKQKLEAQRAFLEGNVAEKITINLTLSRDEMLSIILFEKFGIEGITKKEIKQLESILSKIDGHSSTY